MRRIAFAALLNRPNSVLSPHFGKAKWIVILDENGEATYEQNVGLNGRAVIELMVQHGCTDAIFTHIGSGAFAHLEKTGIRSWLGPAGVPIPALVEALSRGELERGRPSEEEPPMAGETERSHHPGGRCCCSSHQ